MSTSSQQGKVVPLPNLKTFYVECPEDDWGRRCGNEIAFEITMPNGDNGKRPAIWRRPMHCPKCHRILDEEDRKLALFQAEREVGLR